MKLREELQVLLIQAREDEETIKEERASFAAFAQLPVEHIDTINVFFEQEFDASRVDDYDALMIGGSSSEGHDLLLFKKQYVLNTASLIRRAYTKRIPTFASCFGFQLAAVAFGGVLIEDVEHMEMGSYPIHRTDEGRSDPLFSELSEGFLAISGHSKRVSSLPEGAIHLAYSDLCPIHAFKMENAPFYATQFHPEVSDLTLRERIVRYQKSYLDSDEALKKIIEEVQPTPESNNLLARFIDMVVLV